MFQRAIPLKHTLQLLPCSHDLKCRKAKAALLQLQELGWPACSSWLYHPAAGALLLGPTRVIYAAPLTGLMYEAWHGALI